MSTNIGLCMEYEWDYHSDIRLIEVYHKYLVRCHKPNMVTFGHRTQSIIFAPHQDALDTAIASLDARAN